MTDEKVRENLLRRQAKRHGLRLMKSRRRDPQAIDFGGYMLLDATGTYVVAGADAYAYSMDLDQVEAWLEMDHPRKRHTLAAGPVFTCKWCGGHEFKIDAVAGDGTCDVLCLGCQNVQATEIKAIV